MSFLHVFENEKLNFASNQLKNLLFVDPGVKVDATYHRDVLLSQQLLSIMREVSEEYVLFQRVSSSAFCARETVELLKRESPAFIAPDIWPLNSPDLNPVDYRTWSVINNGSTRRKFVIWTTSITVWLSM